MKITLEIEGKDPIVIETVQYAIIHDRNCVYSGAYSWVISEMEIWKNEVLTKLQEEKRASVS